MVVKEISIMQINFLWEGVGDRKRVHWVIWKSACLPLEKGDLGIKNIGDFNLALLNKWRWKILNRSNALWFNLLKVRYSNLSKKTFVEVCFLPFLLHHHHHLLLLLPL